MAADRVQHQVVSAEGLGILETDPIDENQALGVVDREGAQNYLIDKRVKGGGRSNSECKGKYCRRCKRRAPNNRSRRETQVVHEILKPSIQPDVAHLLSKPLAPEFQRNPPSRVGFRQTRMHQVGNAAVDVIPQFAIKIVLKPSLPEPVENSIHSAAPSSKISCTASIRRTQLSFLERSCFCPERVNE